MNSWKEYSQYVQTLTKRWRPVGLHYMGLGLCGGKRIFRKREGMVTRDVEIKESARIPVKKLCKKCYSMKNEELFSFYRNSERRLSICNDCRGLSVKTRVCSKCDQEQDLEKEFGLHAKGIDGRRNICKKCFNIYNGQRNKERLRTRDIDIRNKYKSGLTLNKIAKEYGLSHQYVEKICAGLKQEKDTWKALKEKLKEYQAHETPLRNPPEGIYPIPEREKLPKIHSEVTVKKITDFSPEEQQRMLSLCKPYRDYSGKTVTRI